jgi:hypothetical protein
VIFGAVDVDIKEIGIELLLYKSCGSGPGFEVLERGSTISKKRIP